MELAHADLGSEGKFELKLEGGKLVAVINYSGADAEGALSVALKPSVFIDKLKALIPGKIDDMFFDLLLAKLSA